MATEADHYFAVGDLVNFQKGLDKAGEILQRRAGKVSVVPGNHETEDDIARLCEKFGLNAMHRKTMQVGAYQLAALGYSNVTPFNTPGEYTEEQLAEYLEPFSDLKPLILVCHTPPIGTPLDEAGPGKHFGSSAVKEFIDTHQPEYFFCGHIHEAGGVEATLGKTRGRNLGKKGFLLTV